MGTFAEVEQAEDHVKLIITAGQKVIYRLSPELAKEIGEDLFKKGCNVKGVA